MPRSPASRPSTSRLIRNVLLWLPATWLVWTLLTPYYNQFLRVAGQNLVRLTESPSATQLDRYDEHYAVLTRPYGELAGQRLYSIRLTDIHFPLFLLAALFLAVPGIPWGTRLSNLGMASLIAVAFQVVDLFFWVKFAYATQLGQWSLETYGSFARNFWGLGKHLLDLPFKLALPLLLWGVFYYERLVPRRP